MRILLIFFLFIKSHVLRANDSNKSCNSLFDSSNINFHIDNRNKLPALKVNKLLDSLHEIENLFVYLSVPSDITIHLFESGMNASAVIMQNRVYLPYEFEMTFKENSEFKSYLQSSGVWAHELAHVVFNFNLYNDFYGSEKILQSIEGNALSELFSDLVQVLFTNDFQIIPKTLSVSSNFNSIIPIQHRDFSFYSENLDERDPYQIMSPSRFFLYTWILKNKISNPDLVSKVYKAIRSSLRIILEDSRGKKLKVGDGNWQNLSLGFSILELNYIFQCEFLKTN